ncbi:Fc receptor-like protein 5 [Acanthopagrus latus]|uniref:Fc receptor-like protein 5 n=1 Tax=Acanthopagrus latus TaxID=8177 RepID=UPI00187C05C9|nr:Fc receptor-like protein 5 [Acanthopagrus latus]
MEATSLCFRLLMLELILLETQVQDSSTQKSAAVFLRIAPNSQQHFEYQPISFHCDGIDGSTQLRGNTSAKEFDPECDMKRTSTGSSCTIDRVYSEDSGEYWCETAEGERSNTVNITITDGPVILKSPVLPLMEGDAVTLHCRSKKTISDLTADFYKDGVLMKSSPTGKMTINTVSKSDEGLYKCRIPGLGVSPGSWLVVKAGSVTRESPGLPATKVTLNCRDQKTSTNLTADFPEGVLLFGSSSTREVTIHIVSKSDEGLYKCNISNVGEPLESWLADREKPRESWPYLYVVLVLRTVFTILLVALLLLLVGLLHCGKLRVTHK